MKTIVIVDDHAVVQHGVKAALEVNGYCVVALASNINEARSQIAHTNPDAVIIDINLPDGSGFELISWLRAISKTIGIIILTLNDSLEYENTSRKAGANAFVAKSAQISELIAAVDFAIASPHSFCAQNNPRNSRLYFLTPREIDVLHLLSLGKSNAAIAQSLFLSDSTIKTHISSIFRKLGVDNRVLAIKVARENALLV